MKRKYSVGISMLMIVLVLIAPASGSVLAGSGAFVEPEVEVLHTFSGENVGDYFGWLAENLGDLNHDGVNDLIIPAIFNSQNGPSAGKIYIYSGADFSELNTVLGKPNELFGYSATSAGDVNADGTPDYVIGGPGLGAVPGRVAVYSGADHSLLREWSGTPGTFFGASVAGAGDINHDGYGDILVGAPLASVTYFRAGRAYMFSGKDGSLLWSRDGQAEEARLGSGLGRIGLLDGDTAPDVVVGARGAGNANGGEAYVLSGATGAKLFTLHPFAHGTGERFGQFFASGAGDVNNDGTPDIYLGDYNDKRGGGEGSGRAYIFSGVDGALIHLFNAENKEDGFGPGRGAGDVNGDGYADVIVGAYTNEDAARKGGKAYVFSGKDGSLIRTMTSRLKNDYVGVDALAVGDINQDGLTDFLVTGVNFNLTGLDHSYLIAGVP